MVSHRAVLYPSVYIATPSASCKMFAVRMYHKELFVWWMDAGSPVRSWCCLYPSCLFVVNSDFPLAGDLHVPPAPEGNVSCDDTYLC